MADHSSDHDLLSRTHTMHCHKFIIETARSLLAFGAPAHRLESQLTRAAQVLEIQAEFMLLPNVVFISFHDPEQSNQGSGLHVIKRTGGISISQLRDAQHVYRDVVSLKATPEHGWRSLLAIQHSKTPYSERIRVGVAFLCGAVITILAFDGSFLDAIIAGSAQATLAFLNFYMIGKEPTLARIFECVQCLIFLVFPFIPNSFLKSDYLPPSWFLYFPEPSTPTPITKSATLQYHPEELF